MRPRKLDEPENTKEFWQAFSGTDEEIEVARDILGSDEDFCAALGEDFLKNNEKSIDK